MQNMMSFPELAIFDFTCGMLLRGKKKIKTGLF